MISNGLRRVCWRLLPGLVGCALTPVCLADSWITGLTASQVVTASDSGGQYVQLLVSQPVSNLAGCASADSYISRTLPNATLAVLLSAYTARKSARIYSSSTTCDPPTGRPLFTSVGVMN